MPRNIKKNLTEQTNFWLMFIWSLIKKGRKSNLKSLFDNRKFNGNVNKILIA